MPAIDWKAVNAATATPQGAPAGAGAIDWNAVNSAVQAAPAAPEAGTTPEAPMSADEMLENPDVMALPTMAGVKRGALAAKQGMQDTLTGGAQLIEHALPF
ncbi:MAG: hypothetical protein KGH75_12855, partial [Rhodospirillales bacterium]|nr:hypothetical protein [Rhodospirillales bacterium]